MLKYDWTCTVCGKVYPIKGTDWRAVYGCENCKKGSWKSNMKELNKIIKRRNK